MIKDKLTHMLEHVTPNPDAQSEDYYQDLVTAVRDMRCDKCRFWQPRSTDAGWQSGMGYCTPLENLTLPDFFCALWKPK